MEKPPPDAPQYDPVYLHSLREMLVILLLFSVACVWALCVSFSYGYQAGPDGSVPTILGMPSWVFYSVLLPWLVIDVVACWFCFFYMKNDDLGEAVETSAYKFGEEEPSAIGLPESGQPESGEPG